MWFKIDDKFHAHRKTRKALRTDTKRRDAAAIGLWTLAGDWSADTGTGGWVPADELDRWDDDWHELAARLVDAEYWTPETVDGEPGYRFHDWADHNPTAADVAAKKAAESEGGKRGNHVRHHLNRGIVAPDCALCSPPTGPTDSPPDRVPDSPPSPPVPSRPVPTPSSSAGLAPRGLTDDDLDKIADKTGGDRQHAARVAVDVLDRAGSGVRKPLAYVLRALVEDPDRYRARTRLTKDRECTIHAGQPATNCGGCAADRRAAK